MYQRQLSFGEAVSRALNLYCCFTGRASRSEYWWWVLFTAIIGVAVSVLCAIFGLGQNATSIVSGIISLFFLLPGLGLAWRRLHDIGRGGGWYFIGLVPVVGWIFLLVWFCQQSEPGDNRFGPEPNMVS